MYDARSANAGPAQSWNNYVLIRYEGQNDAGGVATMAQKIAAEQRVRQLIEESGHPRPDRVEYGFTCIRLFFDGPKVVVVIDIDEPEGPEASLDHG